jgi:hypothetical protein
LIVTREYLARSWTFWNQNNVGEAAKMVSAAVARLDTLDDALSATIVDAEAVSASVTEATAACTSCHARFRTHDPATNEHGVQPGLIPSAISPGGD